MKDRAVQYSMQIALALLGLALGICTPQAGHAGSFTPTGAMSVGRYSHTATLLPNGKVLVTGGETTLCGCCVAPTSSAELYDPDSGRWSRTGDMTTTREFHTATLLTNGTVLVAGGAGGDAVPDFLSSAEMYDPTTEKWKTTTPMNVARLTHTATLLADGRVLVAGG